MGVCKRKSANCPCPRCKQGWWSRRHETRDAQDAAREAYEAEHGPAARRRKAAERLAT